MGSWAYSAVYTRNDIIETLIIRYNDKNYQDVWKVSNFAIAQISENSYLLTYKLIQDGNRVSRRATI